MGKSLFKKKKKAKSKKAAIMNFIALTLISAFLFAFTFYCRKEAGKFLSPSAALSLEVIAELIVLVVAFLFFSPSGFTGVLKNIGGIPFAVIGGISIGIG